MSSYSYYYYVKDDKSKTLAYPHYSDPKFAKEVTIFGSEQAGLRYEYADRLIEWDKEADERGLIALAQSGATVRSVASIEAYLRGYYSRTVDVVHVLANVGQFNGYAYYCYGFRFTD